MKKTALICLNLALILMEKIDLECFLSLFHFKPIQIKIIPIYDNVFPLCLFLVNLNNG